MSSMFPLPNGLVPVMLTPLTDEKDVDVPAAKKLTRFMLACNSVALFPVALSGEMLDMTHDQRIVMARAVKKEAGKETAVLACIQYDDSLDVTATRIQEMAAVVDVVVLSVCDVVPDPSMNDLILQQRLEQVIARCPDVHFGLYECPVPYHRLMSLETLKWVANCGRFVFLKDTCRNCDVITERLQAIEGAKTTSPFRWYNGNLPTMLHSLRQGGAGYGGISANVYPFIHSHIMSTWSTDPESAELLQAYLTAFEAQAKWKYPLTAKAYLSRFYPAIGITVRTFKAEGSSLLSEDWLKLDLLHMAIKDLCKRCGIAMPEAFMS